MSFEHKETISGSFGEVWIGDYYVAEATNCQNEWSWEYGEVTKARKLGTYQKLVGGSGSGSITVNKINSFALKEAYKMYSTGKQLEATIIVKVDDPNSQGMERIALKNVNFEQAFLTSFTHKEVVTEEYSYTFAEFEILDTI